MHDLLYLAKFGGEVVRFFAVQALRPAALILDTVLGPAETFETSGSTTPKATP
jgi:hypothetical protein